MSEVKFYISLLMRRLHWVVLIVLVGTASAIWLANTLPKTYSAQAILLAEAAQIPDNLAASTVQTRANEQIQIIRQRVLASNVLIELANRLDIYAHRRATGQVPMDGDAIVGDMQERITIETLRQSETSVVIVAFHAPDPELAAAVTNELANLLLQENLTMRTATARQTLEFFEVDVAQLDQELARRSTAILEFKQENLDALPDTLAFNRGQITALQERLFQIERQEIELRERRDQLLRLQAATSTQVGIPLINTPEATQLGELIRERNRQLIVLSPENPRIRMLNARIDQLKDEVSAQVDANATNDTGQAAGLSPLDIQIDDLERQIANIEAQKPRIEAEVARLNTIIVATPGISATLETLERDYTAIQDQYNQAVANLARAKTGNMIETMSRGQRLSVLESAMVPRHAESPNKPLIIAAGGIGSLGLGVGLVILLNLLRPVIRRPDDLIIGLGITPFATLPYLQTSSDILRRRLMFWGGVAAVSVLFIIALWYVGSEIMPLNALIDQMRTRLD